MQVEMSSFVQQELSNVMWAYGTMQYQPNPHFMQRAAQEMLNRGISKFLPQAISNACWAFAKLDLIHDDFLEVLCSPHTYCPFVQLSCQAVCECVQAMGSFFTDQKAAAGVEPPSLGGSVCSIWIQIALA